MAQQGRAAGTETMTADAAIKWFRNAAMSVSTADPRKMIDSAGNFELISRLSPNSIGKLYLWNYQAKGDGTPQLPYWDRYPMDFILHFYPEQGSFLAMNFHYIAPIYRAKLMDALYNIINNTKLDKTTKLNISYGILKSAAQYRYFKPCLKKYLISHIKSQFLYIKPPLWDVAVLLPLARFKGANQSRVWIDSAIKF